MNPLTMAAIGLGVGIAASFSGLGGGFIVVPLLLWLGFEAQQAVGTSFVVILAISTSAVLAHHRFENVVWQTALALGLGGALGAQLGAYLLEYVSTVTFCRIFGAILIVTGIRLLLRC